MLKLFLALVMAAAPAFAQAAQTVPPTPVQAAPALTVRANEIVALLNGGGDYAATFSSTFRDAVPKDKFDAIAAQLKSQAGSATGVHSISATSPWQATIIVDYQHALVTMLLVVDPAEPHQVTGLRITGAEPRNDSAAALKSDFAKLPGASGFGVYALSTDGIRPLIDFNGDAAAPIGSAFKLWTLAEAAREVGAGARHWSDVITVGQHSLPSGILQSWPAHAPVTLQTAATLMISISDNTAADTLLTTLGRYRVDAMVRTVGVAAPERTLPVLTTREAFALKLPANAALESRWASATPEARRQLLAANARRLAAPIDLAAFSAGPAAIDGIEWFASPADMARTLNWLRLHGGATTQAILAVNPATDSATAARFRYVGYKGGSEPGVISMNYLVESKAGEWFAVTGNWHNSSAAVDEAKFVSLMDRALLLAS
jgi:beta-lactamase class A